MAYYEREEQLTRQAARVTHQAVKVIHVGSHADPRIPISGRLVVEQDTDGDWLVLRILNEDKGTEVLSTHLTEQEAESACRGRMFPQPPEEEF